MFGGFVCQGCHGSVILVTRWVVENEVFIIPRSLFMAHPMSSLQLSKSSQSVQCNHICLLTILITGSGRLVINGK